MSWFSVWFKSNEAKLKAAAMVELAKFLASPQTEIAELWALIEKLVLEAKEHFPAPKEGDNKYKWVMAGINSWLKDHGKVYETRFLDYILHYIIMFFEKKLGVKV